MQSNDDDDDKKIQQPPPSTQTSITVCLIHHDDDKIKKNVVQMLTCKFALPLSPLFFLIHALFIDERFTAELSFAFLFFIITLLPTSFFVFLSSVSLVLLQQKEIVALMCELNSLWCY